MGIGLKKTLLQLTLC